MKALLVLARVAFIARVLLALGCTKTAETIARGNPGRIRARVALSFVLAAETILGKRTVAKAAERREQRAAFNIHRRGNQ